jgi:hypothetical protein
VTFCSLGLALLAGAGAQRAVAAATARSARRWVGPALAALLALAILVEGRGLPFDPSDRQAQPGVPRVPPSTASVAAPQLHLPAERASDNRRYILWSTDGFPKLVNGRSSLNPAFTSRLIRHVTGFPDRRTVAVLDRIGVRSVVLHADRTEGTPWQGAARRPVGGLDVTRRREDGLVVYELR